MSKQPPLKIQKGTDVAILTFNRPEVYNALDTETVTAALSVVRGLQSDPAARVLVFTGAGKSFVAGADIAEMRLVGAAATKELIFTGDIVDARRALEIGLINHVVAHDDLMNCSTLP